jgi:anaerobic ribonucleoside-triphosphate reductase
MERIAMDIQPIQWPVKTGFTRIRKRDGRIAKFDAEKITAAILKAGRATGEFGEDTARRLTIRVLGLAQTLIQEGIPTVEAIQDLVEEVLLASPMKKTAKAYILYRDQHSRIREMVAQADLDLIDRYLERLDWKVNENSNMAYSLQGLNNYISSEISKVYWLNKIYTQEVREAHMAARCICTTSACFRCTAWAGTFKTFFAPGSGGLRARRKAGPPGISARRWGRS